MKAGINQFLENATLYRPAVQEALKKNLLTEKDIDDVIKGEFRVMIRLGLLDPPDEVEYASIKGERRGVEASPSTRRSPGRWRRNRWCC